MPSPKKLTLVQYDDSLSQDFTLQKGKKMQKISVQPWRRGGPGRKGLGEEGKQNRPHGHLSVPTNSEQATTTPRTADRSSHTTQG